MPDIAVAHLVRCSSNGVGLLESFLDVYRRLDPGIEHDLIIIFKGFENKDLNIKDCQEKLSGLSYRPFYYPDVRFDIGAYFAASRAFPHPFFCFLNSYSLPLGSEWLAKLYRHARREEVGVVGATGSYESFLTNIRGGAAGPASGYPPLLRPLACAAPRLASLVYSPVAGWLLPLSEFCPFPNPHVRTTGFMIRRRLLLRLKCNNLENKLDAHKFESGRRSMTRQLLRMGLEALIVGRDGEAYGVSEWYASQTFRSGDQSNLLISDNHTREYDAADPETRQLLASLAWEGKGPGGGRARCAMTVAMGR